MLAVSFSLFLNESCSGILLVKDENLSWCAVWKVVVEVAF